MICLGGVPLLGTYGILVKDRINGDITFHMEVQTCCQILLSSTVWEVLMHLLSERPFTLDNSLFKFDKYQIQVPIFVPFVYTTERPIPIVNRFPKEYSCLIYMSWM